MNVSIIMPVYNKEKYLDKSIKSILDQTYENFELIIINDGWTDNSSYICHRFEQEDSRIKVIDIENNGVGNARNVGIKGATGRYITFLDADDYIEHNMYEKIIKKMGFYLVIFKKSLSTKNQDIKYNHLITNILHSIKIIYFY